MKAQPYLDWAAKAAQPRDPTARQEWLEDRRHRLKHEKGYAEKLLAEMQGARFPASRPCPL